MAKKEVNSIIKLLETFPDEQSCIEFLEENRWKDGIVISPFDPNSKVYKYKNGMYRCKNTKKNFNVRTKTMFESSNVSLRKWFVAIYLATGHKKGVSSHQLARDIDVTVKTAWFMLHRIRECFGEEDVLKLSNKVECDETFVGGKNKNRHKNKKVKNSQGRSFKDKTPVFGMIERKGKVVAKVVPDTKAESLMPEIDKYVEKGAYIYSDEWGAYVKLPYFYTHGVVYHGIGQYVIGDVHTNNIECYWSHLKRMIIGIHHQISRKHLQRYVDAQSFRYNTRNISEYERFELCLQNIEHRLTYKDLTA